MGAGGEGSGFEGPGLDGVVGEEPCAIEVGVVGELGDDGAGGDEEAALEHAAYHGLAATGAAGHLEGGGEAAAFDELDVVAGEVRGETVDVLEGDAAFIGDDGDGEIGGLAVESFAKSTLDQAQFASMASRAPGNAERTRVAVERSADSSDLILMRGKPASSAILWSSSAGDEMPMVAKLTTGRGFWPRASSVTVRFSRLPSQSHRATSRAHCAAREGERRGQDSSQMAAISAGESTG